MLSSRTARDRRSADCSGPMRDERGCRSSTTRGVRQLKQEGFHDV
jgi:hypothetical protein